MYCAVMSNRVQRRPCVVMLLRALTPRPRYIRATPASIGFGELGSGPGNYQDYTSHLSSIRAHRGQDDTGFPKARDTVPQLKHAAEPWFLL